MGVSLKNPILSGRVGRFTKKELPKKGGPWGAWSKRGVVFLGEVDTPMNTM